MKLGKWSLLGLVILSLAMVSLAGCGVSKSDYDALQAEKQTLQADYDALNADYEAAQNELAEIEAVYPPRDFSSFQELQDWLLENDVSERPAAQYAEGLYLKALEIQEDALKDGYIVSAWIDYYFDTEDFHVNCTAVVDGNVWMWNPENDELVNFSGVSGLLKLE